ncbi:MAG: DEAD/DEAH box helicase family protein, partial [Peptoniphilus harei]|uniref:DEAD/DEAH box helicase family protein n=1 Tax=Peptoniphilus harei TaxID=54005 RepID=UPI0028FE4E55
MGNFDFLLNNKNYKDFAEACVDAERSLIISTINAASATRRALELAVKWVYKVDTDLSLPYRDNLSSLTRHKDFIDIIDPGLDELILYIIKLGNLATHTNKKIDKQKAVASLRNLFAFVDWIDYCYGDSYVERTYDEGLIPSLDRVREKLNKSETEDLNRKREEEVDKALVDQRQETPDDLQEKLVENKNKNQNNSDITYKIDPRTEALTRKEFIDVDLELAGWQINKNVIFEVEIDGMPNTSGKGYVDYVLYGEDGLPLALVEAKKTSVDPKSGAHQAHLYAECLEKKYGRRPFYFNSNGFVTWFTDDESQRLVSGFYSQDDLQRMMDRRHLKKSLVIYSINDDITNRYYQRDAVDASIEAFRNNRRSALLVMATGTGKTRTAISIVDILTKANAVTNILFLADRTALVNQAMRNFNSLLPDLSLANLTEAKKNSKDIRSSRMIFSTYQTMINSIDNVLDDKGDRLFTVGHFDLIIIDEAHRSIYQRYKDVFEYFDAKVLGLTATPRDDIDRNTYEIFHLEDNAPTYAYEYEEAVRHGYLVPYNRIETVLEFPSDGIDYDDLPPEEKERFNQIFGPESEDIDISGSDINRWVYSQSTIDIVIEQFMERGIKNSSGNEIGKTIVFAKNQLHAELIKERFDILYPEKGPEYAQVITHTVTYAQDLIDRFSVKDKLPQVAISVNMLDTGIDVPEVVNLVFFKDLFSRIMFMQMIGRGTRLCKDLFGPGLDKKDFLIFDYGGNFKRFTDGSPVVNPPLVKSLSERIFASKVKIVMALQNLKYQEDSYKKIRNEYVNELINEIRALDTNSFRVRKRIEVVSKFKKMEAWTNLNNQDILQLEDEVAPIIIPPKDHEMIQRFDLSVLSLALAILEGGTSKSLIRLIRDTCNDIMKHGNIPAVFDEKDFITDVAGEDFWKDIDFLKLEDMRMRIRNLVPLIEDGPKFKYYVDFEDTIISVEEHGTEFFANDLSSY